MQIFRILLLFVLVLALLIVPGAMACVNDTGPPTVTALAQFDENMQPAVSNIAISDLYSTLAPRPVDLAEKVLAAEASYNDRWGVTDELGTKLQTHQPRQSALPFLRISARAQSSIGRDFGIAWGLRD